VAHQHAAAAAVAAVASSSALGRQAQPKQKAQFVVLLILRLVEGGLIENYRGVAVHVGGQAEHVEHAGLELHHLFRALAPLSRVTHHPQHQIF
jgi:hypothetical protein